jgi:hypothetical protein
MIMDSVVLLLFWKVAKFLEYRLATTIGATLWVLASEPT